MSERPGDGANTTGNGSSETEEGHLAPPAPEGLEANAQPPMTDRRPAVIGTRPHGPVPATETGKTVFKGHRKWPSLLRRTVAADNCGEWPTYLFPQSQYSAVPERTLRTSLHPNHEFVPHRWPTRNPDAFNRPNLGLGCHPPPSGNPVASLLASVTGPRPKPARRQASERWLR